jgi:hypothetical protein
MGSQPRSSIPLEDLQVDEAIDIKLLDSITNDFIWYLAKEHVSDEALKKLLTVICRGCRLYDVPSGRRIDAIPMEERSKVKKFKDTWSPSKETVTLGSDVLPVRRISFAMQCIKSLFSLCSKDGKGRLSFLIFQKSI